LRNIFGSGLITLGLSVFWPAVLLGLRHYVPSGLIVGIVDTMALVLATCGFFLLRADEIGNRKAAIDAISLFLGLNLVAFETQLYFNPYPNYWWSRQASDWIALIGLGTIITNQVVFCVSTILVSTRIALFAILRR